MAIPTKPQRTSTSYTMEDKWETLDSGKRLEFNTGSVRDSDESKPRYELIPIEPLTRLANLYSRGALKYSTDNWIRGQPLRRIFGSMIRHAFQWSLGDKSEDHLAACAWNAFALMWTEEAIKSGDLPAELNNMPAPFDISKKE